MYSNKKKNRQNRRAEKQKNAKCERKLSHKKCSSQHTSKVNRSTNMCNEQSWWQKKKKKSIRGKGKTPKEKKNRERNFTALMSSLFWHCLGFSLLANQSFCRVDSSTDSSSTLPDKPDTGGLGIETAARRTTKERRTEKRNCVER